MKFEHYLQDWCKNNSIMWEYDSINCMHTFTLKPLDPVEASLQECFGDTRFPQCTVSSYVLESVKSLRKDITRMEDIACLTDMITLRIKVNEKLVQ